MMKKNLPAVLFTALLLSACSDDKPSNTLFENTINQFSEKEGLCLPLVLNVQNFRATDTFTQIALGSPVIKFSDQDTKGRLINQTAVKQMDFLSSQGFYKKSSTQTNIKPNSDEKIQILVYELTEDGSKIVRPVPKSSPLFCIGHQKVEKINWYTEPTPSNGMTISRVSYDARFIPEKWLNELLEAGGGSKLPLDEIRTQTATIVKTSEGWKDSRELR